MIMSRLNISKQCRLWRSWIGWSCLRPTTNLQEPYGSSEKPILQTKQICIKSAENRANWYLTSKDFNSISELCFLFLSSAIYRNSMPTTCFCWISRRLMMCANFAQTCWTRSFRMADWYDFGLIHGLINAFCGLLFCPNNGTLIIWRITAHF